MWPAQAPPHPTCGGPASRACFPPRHDHILEGFRRLGDQTDHILEGFQRFGDHDQFLVAVCVQSAMLKETSATFRSLAHARSTSGHPCR